MGREKEKFNSGFTFKRFVSKIFFAFGCAMIWILCYQTTQNMPEFLQVTIPPIVGWICCCAYNDIFEE